MFAHALMKLQLFVASQRAHARGACLAKGMNAMKTRQDAAQQHRDMHVANQDTANVSIKATHAF